MSINEIRKTLRKAIRSREEENIMPRIPLRFAYYDFKAEVQVEIPVTPLLLVSEFEEATIRQCIEEGGRFCNPEHLTKVMGIPLPITEVIYQREMMRVER